LITGKACFRKEPSDSAVATWCSKARQKEGRDIHAMTQDPISSEALPPEPASELAAAAAFLEIGDRLGVLPLLGTNEYAGTSDLARDAGLPEEGIANYLEALAAAGIAEESSQGSGQFHLVSNFHHILYEAGYTSWTMNANRPFIEHAREFLESPGKARQAYRRDGRQVAVSSQWMGSLGFYPAALGTILRQHPRRAADLGAGAGRLLIEVLLKIPAATAVALDIDAGACNEARRAATRAGVGDRLTVIQRPIQSIATDPSPVAGADVINAGFVFHDMLPDEEDIADQVLRECRKALAPGGLMAITDIAPYVTNPRERRFSAIVTYFHQQFMARKPLGALEWKEKLAAAGFGDVECVPLRFPTGRLYIARP
jgi:SAM-dependent methyltransferase